MRITALDRESETRVSLRLDNAGTAVVADAISPAGFELVGGARERARS